MTKIETGNNTKCRQRLDHSYIAVGNEKWYSHSGKQFDGFLQNQTCMYCTSQQLYSWAFSQRDENFVFTQKPVCDCNSPKLETTWWMVEQTGAHPWNGILLSNKKRMNNWYRQQLGWILRGSCWMKKANPQRSPTVWFYLYNIFEVTKF